jgi:hypothetical protein
MLTSDFSGADAGKFGIDVSHMQSSVTLWPHTHVEYRMLRSSCSMESRSATKALKVVVVVIDKVQSRDVCFTHTW